MVLHFQHIGGIPSGGYILPFVIGGTANLADNSEQTMTVTAAQLERWTQEVAAEVTAGRLKWWTTGALTLNAASDGAVQAKLGTLTTSAALSSALVYAADATSGALVPTLPAAASENAGRLYLVYKADSSGNTVTVAGKVLSVQYDAALFVSNGSTWIPLGML